MANVNKAKAQIARLKALGPVPSKRPEEVSSKEWSGATDHAKRAIAKNLKEGLPALEGLHKVTVPKDFQYRVGGKHIHGLVIFTRKEFLSAKSRLSRRSAHDRAVENGREGTQRMFNVGGVNHVSIMGE